MVRTIEIELPEIRVSTHLLRNNNEDIVSNISADLNCVSEMLQHGCS